MAGRHRRPPAWRRLLLRMRRSDRAARFAALQAEVAVLRATITELRTELEVTREAAAVAAQEHAVALTAALLPTEAPSGLQWLSMDLPVVAPADAEPDVADVVAKEKQPLPEAALLDPKQDRDEESVDLTDEIDRSDERAIDLTDAEEDRRIA